MLYGCKELHVYTDHKNLTFHKLSTQRVMRWRLFLEEFQPTFHHIKGENNSLADALSCLPFSERQNTDNFQNKPCAQAVHTLNTNTSAIIDDDNLLDCFVNLPDQTGTNFVLYRDMFPKQSHILAPLTAQVGKRKLQWASECQQAFDTAKAVMAKQALLAYPDHNKHFMYFVMPVTYNLVQQ